MHLYIRTKKERYRWIDKEREREKKAVATDRWRPYVTAIEERRMKYSLLSVIELPADDPSATALAGRRERRVDVFTRADSSAIPINNQVGSKAGAPATHKRRGSQ